MGVESWSYRPNSRTAPKARLRRSRRTNRWCSRSTCSAPRQVPGRPTNTARKTAPRGHRRSQTIGCRAAAALLAAAIALGGCGGHTATPAASRLEREDFLAVSRALQSAEPSVAAEVTAARIAWPPIANGLPANTPFNGAPVDAAGRRAAQLAVPPLFSEERAASLTGPAAGIAGSFRDFAELATRGWQLIGAGIQQVEHGSPTVARFTRANIALYIDSVYDAHFSLAHIGKRLLAGYTKLGGPAAFGASLTQAEVDALARAYSEANDRLHPHAGVKLGS